MKGETRVGEGRIMRGEKVCEMKGNEEMGSRKNEGNTVSEGRRSGANDRK